MIGDSIRVVQPLFPVEGEGSIPISPLQLEIEEIPTEKAIQINKLFHSRLPIIKSSNVFRNSHKICFSAKFNNLWFASAIWSSPVSVSFNGKGYLELRRMAISNDSPKNTASRMLSIMCKVIENKFPEIWMLISYQDTEVHNGTIYKASGWIKGNESVKSNWLVGRKDGRHRNQYVAGGAKVRWEKQIRSEPCQKNTSVDTQSQSMKQLEIQF